MTRAKILLTAALVAAPLVAVAGPEKVEFPASFRDNMVFTPYVTVNNAEDKTIRDLYVSRNSLDGTKIGQPLVDGTVLVMESFAAKVDRDGNPIVDDKGNFQKERRLNIWVMEKREGWGAEYPAGTRAGDWEFASFTSSGRPIKDEDFAACFSCHRQAAATDYVFSFDEILHEGWLMD